MTNVITLSLESELIQEIDKIRKRYEMNRSKFVKKIIKYVCKDEKKIQEAIKWISTSLNRSIRI